MLFLLMGVAFVLITNIKNNDTDHSYIVEVMYRNGELDTLECMCYSSELKLKRNGDLICGRTYGTMKMVAIKVKSIRILREREKKIPEK